MARPTPKELRSIFYYDTQTGKLYYRNSGKGRKRMENVFILEGITQRVKL